MDAIEKIKSVDNGDLTHSDLLELEREIALKILDTLDGTLVVRAIPILEFCLKAIKYTEFKTFNQ